MKQSAKYDPSKTILEQVYQILSDRYPMSDLIFIYGLEHWHHKTARKILSLIEEHQKNKNNL